MRSAGMLVCLLLVSATAAAQIRAVEPKPRPRLAAPKQPTPLTQTDLRCERYEWRQHKTICQALEREMFQNLPHRLGRPIAASEVVYLPERGTPDANAMGLACIGGQAIAPVEERLGATAREQRRLGSLSLELRAWVAVSRPELAQAGD